MARRTDSPSHTPSHSSENCSVKTRDEFPQPPAKRRRVSSDEDKDDHDDDVPVYYAAPSRVKKELSSNHVIIDTSPTQTASPAPTTLTSSTFDSLDVAPWLIHSLRSMAITNPTEIQRSCIPEILKGRDCIGGSKTGTGKTVAFAVPILQKWAVDPFGIYAVILTPTRELALQIYEQFLALGASQSLKVVLVTGGSDMRPQALALSQRPHVVVATPGRLADHIQTSGKETTIGLTRAKVVVLDEADRLLASGPGSMLPDLNTCLSAMPTSSSRLTLLFTATVTPEVRALKSLPRPSDRPPIFISEINDPTSSTTTTTILPLTLTQTYLLVPLSQKDAFLHTLLSIPTLSTSSIIIFTNRTTTADILHRTLLTLSHACTSLHSRLPQSQRTRNLSSFRSHKTRILIATDVASRGLDIPDVSHVINFDVPRDPTDYIHRVGRTARAGKEGTSITFISPRDIALIHAIEEHVGNGDSEAGKMAAWKEEGVNLETRVVKGRTLKDVAEARMEAMREVEGGREVGGWRRGVIKKERKRAREQEAA